jgi:hypothetical protein
VHTDSWKCVNCLPFLCTHCSLVDLSHNLLLRDSQNLSQNALLQHVPIGSINIWSYNFKQLFFGYSGGFPSQTHVYLGIIFTWDLKLNMTCLIKLPSISRSTRGSNLFVCASYDNWHRLLIGIFSSLYSLKILSRSINRPIDCFSFSSSRNSSSAFF